MTDIILLNVFFRDISQERDVRQGQKLLVIRVVIFVHEGICRIGVMNTVNSRERSLDALPGHLGARRNQDVILQIRSNYSLCCERPVAFLQYQRIIGVVIFNVVRRFTSEARDEAGVSYVVVDQAVVVKVNHTGTRGEATSHIGNFRLALFDLRTQGQSFRQIQLHVRHVFYIAGEFSRGSRCR